MRPVKGVPAGTVATSAIDWLLGLVEGHRLSPTQRRIAQYLLEHLPDAALLSSTDLATRVDVSQPSVTRFAAALGFEGYQDFRRQLGVVALGAPTTSPEEVRRNEFQSAVAAGIRNLEDLAHLLADPRQIVETGRELAASRPLAVLGLRISAGLATYFGYGARKIHPDVRILTDGGSSLGDTLLQCRQAGGRMLLAFAMPRCPAETVVAMRLARTFGLRVAVVTDRPLAPVGLDADVVLPAPVSSLLVLDSQPAPMMLATVLLQAMCDALPTQSQQRLEELEQSVATRRVFHDG